MDKCQYCGEILYDDGEIKRFYSSGFCPKCLTMKIETPEEKKLKKVLGFLSWIAEEIYNFLSEMEDKPSNP